MNGDAPLAGMTPLIGIDDVTAETFIWSAPELMVNCAGENKVPRGMMLPDETLVPDVLIVMVPA